MARRTESETRFHAKHWGNWLAAVRKATGSTTEELTAIISAPGRDDEGLSSAFPFRVEQWLNGEANVEPDTAFRIGQSLARTYKRFDFAGPFAVYGSGYIAAAVDILRRLDIDEASECFRAMWNGARIYSLEDIPSEERCHPDKRYYYDDLNGWSDYEDLLDKLNVIWKDIKSPMGTEPKWLVGYGKEVKLAHGILEETIEAPDHPTLVEKRIAQEWVRNGEHSADIPMVQRFYAGEIAMEAIKSTAKLLGPDEGWLAGVETLRQWVQRFDRNGVWSEEEFTLIRRLLESCAKALHGVVLDALRPIFEDYEAELRVVDRFAFADRDEFTSYTYDVGIDDPFNFPNDRFFDEPRYSVGESLKMKPAYLALLRALYEDAIATQEDLDSIAGSPNFSVALPNMERNGRGVLPRISELAADIRSQAERRSQAK